MYFSIGRDAEKEALEVLVETEVPADYRIHRHCFTGDWDAALSWINQYPGTVFGFTNLVTKPEMGKLQKVVK